MHHFEGGPCCERNNHNTTRDRTAHQRGWKTLLPCPFLPSHWSTMNVYLCNIRCKWMENHTETIHNLANIENYMQSSNMQTLSEYATDVELFCSTSWLNMPIWTYTPNGTKDNKQHYQGQQHASLPGTHTPPLKKAVYFKNTHVHLNQSCLNCSVPTMIDLCCAFINNICIHCHVIKDFHH